jgi:Arm DNA-binding domain
MPKRSGLSVKKIEALLKKPGRYSDGNSLYFQVTTALSRSWEFHYRIHARKRTMGLGPYPEVSLKEARELRDEPRKLVRNGIHPIIARSEKRQVEAASLTVMQAADGYIEAKKEGGPRGTLTKSGHGW